MLLKLAVVFIMLIGLVCTFFPRLTGTLVIFAGAAFYLVNAGAAAAPPWVLASLVSLSFTAEVGGRLLRYYLTRRYAITRAFSVNTTWGNIGGIVAADAILGPVLGLLVWELLVGKTLAPRWDTVGQVLLRLFAAAALRFACGLLMIILMLVYVMG